MWIEEVHLENIRCFDSATLRFKAESKDKPARWITFLSENGGGKSTVLQAMALLLAGPEGAQKLLPRPLGWLREEGKHGQISAMIHQDDDDPGAYSGLKRKRTAFRYSYHLTGSLPLTVNHKRYSDATIIPVGQAVLTWLREHAFSTQGKGWFAVGYGAFRRLTRSNQIIVPLLEQQARFTNFSTQFFEDEPLAAFERWMVYLDYQIAKNRDPQVERHQDLGIQAINQVLPKGAKYDSVDSNGKILFNINGRKVPTISLSDGYRSILALAGDLVWRLLQAFPESNNPMHEPGVVLIDELDIHLHPIWQRDIPRMLRDLFPNLQFIVATHSPLIAAGAGEDALTYRFRFDEGCSRVELINDIFFWNVDRILQSEAFGLVSPYAPETQRKIDRYDKLTRKKDKTKSESKEYQDLLPFIEQARPLGGPPQPGSLDEKIEKFLEKALP